MRQIFFRIASILFVLIVAATAFFFWNHSRPLVIAADQPFQFENHARNIDIEGKRPSVASTVAGGLYLLATQTSDPAAPALTLRMSHDGGEHWMQPTPLSTPGSIVTSSSENAPQLAARAMFAFALWQEKGSSGVPQLRLARSSGMDAKPPTSTIITDKPSTDTSYSGFASLSIAPNGDIYVVWLDGRDQTSAATGTFNVYLARSTDRGFTFHPNVRVATLACPCCRPSIAISPDGKVYVAYRHVFGDNERDIAIAVSNDSGDHFSTPVRVSSDRWKLFGCPESGPVLALQGSKLIVVWYTAAEDRPGIRVAVSTNGAQSFSSPVLISRGIQNANHPYLSESDGGDIAIAFSGRAPASNGAWGAFMPYIVRIDTRGRISMPEAVPTMKTGDRYPTVSLSPDGDAYLTWSNTDEPQIYLARATSR